MREQVRMMKVQVFIEKLKSKIEQVFLRLFNEVAQVLVVAVWYHEAGRGHLVVIVGC